MFEVGLIELVVIGVVALLVVGPERLPGVARTLGRWYGRAQRFLSTVSAEIRREIAAEELRQALNKHAALREDFQELSAEAAKIEAEIKAAACLQTPESPAADTQSPVAAAESSAGPEGRSNEERPAAGPATASTTP